MDDDLHERTPETFEERIRQFERQHPVTITELPNGDKEIALTLTTCETGNQSTREVQFVCIATGARARLPRHELIDYATRELVMDWLARRNAKRN